MRIKCEVNLIKFIFIEKGYLISNLIFYNF